MTPPKPPSRSGNVSLWRYLRLFRKDILSAQPERLYRAWMAEFRTPFFHSAMVNDPDLLKQILQERPEDFPKSARVTAGLSPLLGESVFVTNGEIWRRQRRIIDPAFEGGRLKESFGAIWAAGEACSIEAGTQDIEPLMSQIAADVIFRVLFSIPIDAPLAQAVYSDFRQFQTSQPVLTVAAFLPWWPFKPRIRPEARDAALRIREHISELVESRAKAIAVGNAPDDLATKLMTLKDPETGQGFSTAEMVDQVAIFFLAGHETSAAALGWALYLLATHPEWQDRVADEALQLEPKFATLTRLPVTRDVFRETLRLYPPVPMMVRQSVRAEVFRKRQMPQGTQVVLSPWHLHRHERLWDRPDEFDPARWALPEPSHRKAYMPFSKGARVCPGAGFAMAEGTLLIAMILRQWRIQPVPNHRPIPEAHLTVRARNGIRLNFTPRKDV